jgi:NAD(P)-dependent dehydrogenase (short-subunit alcohol dehydrogenase family)
MAKLTGLVALVTGAARLRGIGRATALRLAEDGADVAVIGRPREVSRVLQDEAACGWRGAESVVEEIKRMGRRATALRCDVTDASQVEEMIDNVRRELGGLHIVVNNAGIASNAGAAPIINMDDVLWVETLSVNLTGVYLVSKFASKAFIASNTGGAIVNISSMAGRKGMPNTGAYCASKFGVIGLTQQMAVELAPYNIRVNCICPGSTQTDMMDATFGRVAQSSGLSVEHIIGASIKDIPLGRQGLPAEQAAAIAFLAGPDASFITGQTLNVDGGARMD